MSTVDIICIILSAAVGVIFSLFLVALLVPLKERPKKQRGKDIPESTHKIFKLACKSGADFCFTCTHRSECDKEYDRLAEKGREGLWEPDLKVCCEHVLEYLERENADIGK